MAGVSFLMMTYLPRDIQNKLVTGWVIAYNSALFLYFMITCFGCWNMDVTTYIMMLTAKLWGLAWAVKDGYVHKQNLSESQLKLRVVDLPTFVEFMGFVSFGPGCLVGPFIEFRDYIDFMERRGEYEDMPCGLSMPTFVPSMIQLLKSFAMGGFKEFVCGYLGFNNVFVGSKEFLTYKTFWHRFVYYNISMTGQRFLYYCLFSLQDCGLISSGIGWNGVKDGANDWNKLPCIIIKEVEFSNSPVGAMKGWNHSIHLWLNRYVQDRLVKVGQKPGMRETVIVFLVSAFWHGFYPFYYVMFFYAGIFVELAKEFFRARILFRWIPAPLDFYIPWTCTMLILNYFGVSFNQLTFDRGYSFGVSTYFWVWILLPVLLAAVKLGGLVKYAKKVEAAEKAKKAGTAVEAKKDK